MTTVGWDEGDCGLQGMLNDDGRRGIVGCRVVLNDDS